MTTFFTLSEDRKLVPEPASVSAWSPTQIGGYAVCGALARQIERSAPTEGFVPTRLTVDLFKPVRTEPLETRSTVVRQGSRIAVVDSSAIQDGEMRSRATAIYVIESVEPPGELWHSAGAPPTPPDEDPDSLPFIKSGDGPWIADFAAHQNSDRKSLWQNFPPLVDGEELTSFQRAALIGENTSLVCHWGTAGVGFINTDMTLGLSRLPEGNGVGLRADSQTSHGGVSVGTATVFDRRGIIGTCTVTAISNARRQVDVTSLNY